MVWSNAGDESVPYGSAFDGEDAIHTPHESDGTVPFFSTVPAPSPRSDKLCIGEGHTCKGFKAKGTALCMGHLRRKAKEQREAAEAAVCEPLTLTDEMVGTYLEVACG